ncbi:MAG: UDP-4-amino-4,6-dideoxy-N-acetyl-beta-L-altrosamine transaminase [Acidobacteria bacterium]|nr:UDP-4-amino-4,6-dideoxy-N-acetyl-beta-L-altrosamine transaminase [Acidobacteriota bacterium]
MTGDQQSLAINGGVPVRDRLLPYGRQTIVEEDITAVVEALRSDWITTGPRVEEFEGALAEAVGASHAVCFSSGTAALHAAVFAAGIGTGDEAITTPLTFCATANCLLYQGATPVFGDVLEDTLTLDPKDAADRITSRTKAIVPVDYAGHPAELDAFMELAERHRLVIIEDAAQALGATYRKRRVGAVSHMTTFSFHPVKHITTGEGGAVTTNDSGLAERLRLFRNHGITTGARERQNAGEWRYQMVALGYNYRLSDIGCALGLSQLPRLEANIACRQAIAARYAAELADVPCLRLPTVETDVESAWHLYPVRIVPPIDRDDVCRALRAEGLGVNVHYSLVYDHPYYQERFGGVGARWNAEAAGRQLMSLPIFGGMSTSDIDDVVTAVRKVLTYFALQKSL